MTTDPNAPGTEDASRKDFFVSYTGQDDRWAEWIAWQLEDAGYTTILQAWDFAAGSNFVLEMDRASKTAARTIAVLSKEYVRKVFTQQEWAAAARRDPTGEGRGLIPVRIDGVQLDGLLAQVVYVDLLGLDESAARTTLLTRIGASVSNRRGKPEAPPAFPGANSQAAAPFPGSSPIRVMASYGAVSTHRRFLSVRLPAEDWLRSEKPQPPYFDPQDSTGDGAVSVPKSLSAFLWLPSPEYLESTPLQEYTPLACVISPNADAAATTLGTAAALGIDSPPNKVRNEDKVKIYETLATAFADSFIAAVTVPKLMLNIGRNRPELAYQAMLDLFLLPLLEMHRLQGVERMSVYCAGFKSSTKQVIGIAKRMAKGVYMPGGYGTADVAPANYMACVQAARFIAWAVGTSHNSNNASWITLLERLLNANETDPSRGERSVSATPHAGTVTSELSTSTTSPPRSSDGATA